MRCCRVASLCFGLVCILPGQVQHATRSTPGQVCGLTRVVAVAAGGIGGLALKSDGTVWEWYGPSPPMQVSELSGIVLIAAGTLHNMALKSDGTVWEWTSLWGGTIAARPTRTPYQISDLTGAVAIAAGESRSLAVKADGTVWEWVGKPAAGFSHVVVKAPYQVRELNGVVAVSVAVEWWWDKLLLVRNLALKKDGTVWVWDEGEWVKGGAPVQVGELSGVVSLAAGPTVSLALKKDGTIWGWSTEYTPALQAWFRAPGPGPRPVRVSELAGVVAVAAGAAESREFPPDPHGLALESDGTVWAWGSNHNGQLGDGSTRSSTWPVRVSKISEVGAIAAAGVYVDGTRPVSLAIKRDGTVWTWGETWNAGVSNGTTCHEP